MKKYILALDQGTTSSRAVVFDHNQRMVAIAQKEFTQFYPKEGYVEHDPMEIFATQYGVMMEVIAKSGISPQEIAAIGLTNQRETAVVWNRHTGKPIYNAIVWQCRRTASICEELLRRGLGDYIHQSTGLPVDAYFSGTKIKWILDHVPGARKQAEQGDLLFGTIDTWLIWKLTNGKAFVTDYTNASRTMLYNIQKLCWDETICKALKIPMCMLASVKNSSEVYAYVDVLGEKIPLAGVAGDQQAALFGQTCFEEGMAKNTYGTGCFLLMHTGENMRLSQNGLITTIAAGLNGRVTYAVEGSVFVGGAVIQWLRDEMRFFDDAADTSYFAQKVKDNGGVYVVPAFTGLGAPYWDMYARGTIVGLTRGVGRNHIIRAALESIAYQSKDVMDAMVRDTGVALEELRVDGGACANEFLMQFQSDILQGVVKRPKIRETTALGAAYLAGLAVGFWKDLKQIQSMWEQERAFVPQMPSQTRDALVAKWHKAVGRACRWEEME